MYAYILKHQPTSVTFAKEWDRIQTLKQEDKLLAYKKVDTYPEGTEWGKTYLKNASTGYEQRKWCAATETLTVYKNDKGFFTRKAKKVNDEWKTLFIPVYFDRECVFTPVAEKTVLTAELHWIVTGTENLKLAVKIDKVHGVGDADENV